jgi:hypothetical protein
MFLNFYPTSSPADASEFSTSVANCDVSAAQVQGYFMFYKHSARDAIENAYRLMPQKEEKKISTQPPVAA